MVSWTSIGRVASHRASSIQHPLDETSRHHAHTRCASSIPKDVVVRMYFGVADGCMNTIVVVTNSSCAIGPSSLSSAHLVHSETPLEAPPPPNKQATMIESVSARAWDVEPAQHELISRQESVCHVRSTRDIWAQLGPRSAKCVSLVRRLAKVVNCEPQVDSIDAPRDAYP